MKIEYETQLAQKELALQDAIAHAGDFAADARRLQEEVKQIRNKTLLEAASITENFVINLSIDHIECTSLAIAKALRAKIIS